MHQFYLAVKFQSELDVFSLNRISSTMRVKVAQPLVGAGGGKGGSHMTQGGAHSRGAGQREPSRARQAREAWKCRGSRSAGLGRNRCAVRKPSSADDNKAASLSGLWRPGPPGARVIRSMQRRED